MKPNQIEAKALCIVMRNNQDILVSYGYDTVKQEHFGRILGGGIEFGETGEEAVRREFREELNSEIENLQFISVIENIFTYNGNHCHQLIFLYKGDLADKGLYGKDTMPILDKEDLEAAWLSLKDIEEGKVKLYPEFSQDLLV